MSEPPGAQNECPVSAVSLALREHLQCATVKLVGSSNARTRQGALRDARKDVQIYGRSDSSCSVSRDITSCADAAGKAKQRNYHSTTCAVAGSRRHTASAPAARRNHPCGPVNSGTNPIGAALSSACKSAHAFTRWASAVRGSHGRAVERSVHHADELLPVPQHASSQRRRSWQSTLPTTPAMTAQTKSRQPKSFIRTSRDDDVRLESALWWRSEGRSHRYRNRIHAFQAAFECRASDSPFLPVRHNSLHPVE